MQTKDPSLENIFVKYSIVIDFFPEETKRLANNNLITKSPIKMMIDRKQGLVISSDLIGTSGLTHVLRDNPRWMHREC